MGFMKCILYSAAIGFLSFLIGRVLPAAWFSADRFPYKTWKWENGGNIYNQLFHIRRWQAKVPDMSKLFKSFMPQKKMTADFDLQLPVMIRETCIAELIHVILCFLSLPCMIFSPGTGGVLFTFFYILGNLPFIFIQRYNRPRFLRLQHKITSTSKRKDS